MADLNEFELLLTESMSGVQREALRDMTDLMHAMRVWGRTYGVEMDPDHLMYGAVAVLNQETELRLRQAEEMKLRHQRGSLDA